MRIVNEKHLALIWNWDKQESDGLLKRFQTNLERMLYAVQERIDKSSAPATQDLRDLAGELQEAGETLQQCAQNCFEAARNMYVSAADTPDQRCERQQFLEQIIEHVGKPVILKQTSVQEIEGRQLQLEEIRGIKGILRDGDDLWEALVDFLVPVLQYDQDQKEGDN